jgi:hypothetical protein
MRIVALLLLVVLSFTMLTACPKPEGEGGTTPPAADDTGGGDEGGGALVDE